MRNDLLMFIFCPPCLFVNKIYNEISEHFYNKLKCQAIISQSKIKYFFYAWIHHNSKYGCGENVKRFYRIFKLSLANKTNDIKSLAHSS